jgi:serine/threonine protein kinase
VALKEMSEAAIEPHDRHDVIALFKREAELLATLDHPNLVKVSDLFQEEGRHYMVMEFIDGQTLLAMLEQRNTPFPEDQVLGWAAQLCDVLDYLHAQNPKIIYRDLKPGNVMVARGSDAVKLIDFGIARFHTPGKRKDTVQIGTPGYAPPEQHGRAQTDERADIYALGAMLHHLLTLMDPTDKPFSFPPVCNCNRNVSKRVEAAIAKAVRSKPDERHQSAAEMMAALGVELPRCAEATPRPKPKVPPPQAKQPSPPKSKTPTAGTPAPGRLLLSQPSLLLGTVIRGAAAAPRSFDAIVPGGGSAQVITDRPWLHAHPSTVSQGSHEVTVTVNPDLLGLGRLQLQVKRRSDGFWSWLLYALARWAAWHARFLVPVERQHQGHVTVRLADGSEQEADVSVMVKPAPWMCYLGWGGVGLAMLGEIGAVVGLAVLLI